MKGIYDLMCEKESRFEIIDFDKECEKDLVTERGFIISERAFKKKDKDKAKNKYGTHSPKFGTDWEDEDSFADRYRCGCGALKSKAYLGRVCPICNEEVTFKHVDYQIFGWIVLDDHYIIHPLLYHIIANAIGEKVLEEIIRAERPVDLNGNFSNDFSQEKEKPTTPFCAIGIEGFKDRFIEIMLYYKNKNKNKEKKQEAFSLILKNREKVFTHCIPVFSSMLRPLIFKGEKLDYTVIDRKYNSIVSTVLLLNESNSSLDNIDIPYKLRTVQNKVLEIWDEVFSIIDQKDGFIKGQIIGGRLNYTARNVIVPDPSLKANQVKLGYRCFMELYRLEILALVSKTKNITQNEALNMWNRAMIVFDPIFYGAIKHIVKNDDPTILINRPPTIDYGSIICMTVAEVCPDIDMYTLALPIPILNGLNADFDGDNLSIASLKAKNLKKAFKKAYNPRDNFFISRDNGVLNRNASLLKDQLIGLRDFCTI